MKLSNYFSLDGMGARAFFRVIKVVVIFLGLVVPLVIAIVKWLIKK